jgi:hypothetical protein
MAGMQDGVEDGQEFAHDGDQGEAGWFAGFAQTTVEALEPPGCGGSRRGRSCRAAPGP